MHKEKTFVSPGSVTKYRTKSGTRWRWQAFVGIEPGGSKPTTVRVGEAGFSTKREASDAMLERLHLIRAEGFSGSKDDASPILTFSCVTSEWIESLDLANSTLAGYRKIIRNHLEPRLGSLSLIEISTDHLNRLYKSLLEGGRKDSKGPGQALKANTVNKCHQVIRSILDFAVTHEYLETNISRSPKVMAPTSRRVKAQKEEIEVWTMAETKAVLRWNEEVERDDLNVLWRLYALTGMRRGEGIALKWKDIDFENSTVNVVRSADSALAKSTKSTKTYRHRSIDLDPDLLKYLQHFREERAVLGQEYVAASSYVFGTINNELRGPNDVTRRWAKMVRRAQEALADMQLPWVTLQGLRHGHATHLLQARIQPKVVQERLGHSNIQTTMDIYSHVLPTIQRDALGTFMKEWDEAS